MKEYGSSLYERTQIKDQLTGDFPVQKELGYVWLGTSPFKVTGDFPIQNERGIIFPFKMNREL